MPNRLILAAFFYLQETAALVDKAMAEAVRGLSGEIARLSRKIEEMVGS